MNTYSRLYLITIYNGSDALVCKQEIQARNENEALKEILEQITICDGDSITIEEA